MTPTAAAAMFGNDGWAELTDNDQDPTPEHWDDFGDWWTGYDHGVSRAELYEDPLLAVLLGVPIPTSKA